MLVGWTHWSGAGESRTAYLLHQAGVPFKELRVERPESIHQSLQDVMQGYESEDAQVHKFKKIEDLVFEQIGFPILVRAHGVEAFEPNCTNEFAIPELQKWDALVEALRVLGGMLEITECTGKQLHDLATQVEWCAAGGRSAGPRKAWSCKNKAKRLGKAASGHCMTLGYSLGEATLNLWMKMRIEGFIPKMKAQETAPMATTTTDIAR